MKTYYDSRSFLDVEVRGVLTVPSFSGSWQGDEIDASYIGNLPASKITSGTFGSARFAGTATDGFALTLVGGVPTWSDNSTYLESLGAGASLLTTVDANTVGVKSLIGIGGIVITEQANTVTLDGSSISGGGGGMTDPGANGFLVRTALNTTAARTLTGTTNRITITNTTGGGNPVFDIGTDVVTLTGSQTLTNKSIVATQLTGDIDVARLTVLRQSKAKTFIAPTASELQFLFRNTGYAITITAADVVMQGTSPSVTYAIHYGSTFGTSLGTIVASNTATTTGTATLNVTAIPSNSYIWVVTSAVSGTITEFTPQITFRQ
jgi:hypothetical protein